MPLVGSIGVPESHDKKKPHHRAGRICVMRALLVSRLRGFLIFFCSIMGCEFRTNPIQASAISESRTRKNTGRTPREGISSTREFTVHAELPEVRQLQPKLENCVRAFSGDCVLRRVRGFFASL